MKKYAKVIRFHVKILIFSIIFLSLIISTCEAKAYKVIVGYENEQLEIPLVPGRASSNNSVLSIPTSQQMNSKLPVSKDIKTVVPADNPVQPTTSLIPVEDSVPMMHGGLPQNGGSVMTAANIKEKLDYKGRAILGNITFAFDKSNLTSKSIPMLKALKEYLTDNPSAKIIIEGHCCDSGNDFGRNPMLSLDRASAVKEWLVNNGIDTYRLGVIGMSDDKPIATNSTEAGRAKNRRIEIIKE